MFPPVQIYDGIVLDQVAVDKTKVRDSAEDVAARREAKRRAELADFSSRDSQRSLPEKDSRTKTKVAIAQPKGGRTVAEVDPEKEILARKEAKLQALQDEREKERQRQVELLAQAKKERHEALLRRVQQNELSSKTREETVEELVSVETKIDDGSDDLYHEIFEQTREHYAQIEKEKISKIKIDEAAAEAARKRRNQEREAKELAKKQLIQNRIREETIPVHFVEKKPKSWSSATKAETSKKQSEQKSEQSTMSSSVVAGVAVALLLIFVAMKLA